MSARILIIDQSRIVHQTVRLSLSDLAEITALTDATAVTSAEGPWDLVLASADLEAQLPALVTGLRQQSPGLRLIVAVSVMKELAPDVQARLGPCEVVRKPWVSRDFRELVERMLSEAPPIAAEPMPAAAEMGDESSLPTALNEASLEAITAPPEVEELDSPFSSSAAESGFEQMPSTQEFAELISGVPETVDDELPPIDDELPPVIEDEMPPMGDLEAEVESMANDFDAGLSELEERLNELPQVEPAAEPVTLPPAAARQAPDLADQVLDLTTPPTGELDELPDGFTDAPSPVDEEVLPALPLENEHSEFHADSTGEVSTLDDTDELDELDDLEPPQWADSGTDEFSELSAPEELHDPEETNASMIAALNALEEAAGMVEEGSGLGAVQVNQTAEELAAVEFEPTSELPAETGSPLTPEQWIALRAEMRDTVEAMISELVPDIAQALIKDEIARLTSGFSPSGDDEAS